MTMDPAKATNPMILVIGSDPANLERIAGQLERRYAADYEVARVASGAEAAEIADRAAAEGRRIALTFSSLLLSDTDGWEAMGVVRSWHPGVLRVLCLEPGNREEGQMVQRPLQMGLAEDYVLVPQVSPDETFHMEVSELLAEWARSYGKQLQVGRMVGRALSARTHEVRDLLARNGVPFGFHEAGSQEGQRILSEAEVDDSALPVLVLWDGRTLRDPTNAEIADSISGGDRPDWTTFDVSVIGGGPAGLAASVYAASEGLSSLVLEHRALGGQAGTTSRIRNYLGFPRGISGQELSRRALDQAWTFGVAFQFSRSAESISRSGDHFVIGLSDGVEVRARSVVLALGVDYRRLDVPALEAKIGLGVYYSGALTEAEAMTGRHVFVVGGGNSAGQAAVHLSKYAGRVTMVVRDSSLAVSMSTYLIREIGVRSNIQVRTGCRIVDGGGEDVLEFVELCGPTGVRERHEAVGLFILIGAEPRIEWLPHEVLRDEWGYILTGLDTTRGDGWPLERPPLAYETSLPGVFAVGDVRHGAVKRVASAVGEGSVVIQGVHRYLQGSPRTPV